MLIPHHTRRPALALSLPVLLFAPNVARGQQVPAPASPPIDLAAHPIGGMGLDLAARDPAVKPGDDFFLSVNGTWYAKAVIPPTFTAAGAWFEPRIKSVWREQAILDAAAGNATAPPGSPEAKIGAFYRAFLNEARAESLGLTPLQPALDAIRAARTRSAVARLLGQLAGPGTVRAFNTIGPPPGRGVFSVDIGQDPEVPTRHAVLAGTPGVLLATPRCYVDPRLTDVRQAYEAHLARVLGLIGWTNPDASANEIVAFETRALAVRFLAELPRCRAAWARRSAGRFGRATSRVAVHRRAGDAGPLGGAPASERAGARGDARPRRGDRGGVGEGAVRVRDGGRRLGSDQGVR